MYTRDHWYHGDDKKIQYYVWRKLTSLSVMSWCIDGKFLFIFYWYWIFLLFWHNSFLSKHKEVFCQPSRFSRLQLFFVHYWRISFRFKLDFCIFVSVSFLFFSKAISLHEKMKFFEFSEITRRIFLYRKISKLLPIKH